MANRFPLVLDTTDGNKIKEIPAGDNLDLRNVSIEDVQNINALGTINAAAVQINGQNLKAGEFVDLADVPNSYNGFEGYLVKVKDDGTGLEFTTLGAGGSDFAVNDIILTGDIIPDQLNVSNIGSTTKRFAQIHSQIFQGSIKGFDGSTVFDATTNQIPYAVIVGRPENVSDLPNDAEYITRAQLKATLPEVLGEDLTIEVNQTGNLQGSVFGEDSTILVDHLNSRINAARLTQNGAEDGQTIVWNSFTEVWEPGIAGDITGLSSNKIDTLTVEAGYKFTFGANPGLIEADGIQITTNTDPVTFNGDMELSDGKTFAPATDGQGSIGTGAARFGNGYFDNLDGNSITGTLTGTAESTSLKTDSAVLGDKTAGDGGYDIHVVGTVGFTGGSMNMNGSSLIAPNLVNATGDIKGSVFGDDSTPLVDAVNNTVSADIVTSSITGSTIDINATTKVVVSDMELTGEMYPDTDETGFVGTTTKKFAEGNFVTVNSDTISVASFSTASITTEDLSVTGTGNGEITSGADIIFTAGNRSRFAGGPVKVTTVTQAERANIVPQSGDIVYNTTANGFQLYEDGDWTTLHKGVFTGDVVGGVYFDDSTTIIDGLNKKVVSPTVTGNATFENNVIVSGDLTVQGTTTTIDTANTEIKDNIILLNNGEIGAGVTAGTAGFEIDRGSEANVTFLFNDTTDKWTIANGTFEAGAIEAASITSDGSGDATGFANITGASGGDITQFTNITGDSGGDITQFTNITGDSGGTISGFTTITGDTGGNITGFTNITGDTGGTISGFTTLTGDGGGSITGFDIGWGLISSTPTTLAGYGITDAATSAQGTNADTAFGWGNHALAGYLTAVPEAITSDVTGSVFADDSTTLVDGPAGKLVGDYENGTSVINNTSVTSYDLVALQDANINDLYVSNKIYGGATGSIKNVQIASTAPTNSVGAAGDKSGMIAFDATSIYYCIADYVDGLSDIWVKQDWGTTGSW
jgi:hypothetical protein